MTLHELIWPEDRVDHIARHGVNPEEVEEVCFGRPLTESERRRFLSGERNEELRATEN